MQYNRLNNPNALIDLIKALDKRVSNVETKGTGTIGFVGDDGVELHIGVQPDGEAAIVPFVGDTTPPPVASAPTAVSGPGFISVTWDGLFVDLAEKPRDFDNLNVIGHKVVSGSVVQSTSVGIIRNTLDSCLVGTDVMPVGETWKFSFVSEDYNGNLSAFSEYSAVVTQQSFAADVLIDEALEGLQQDYINAQNAAASAQQAANDAQEAADAVAEDLTATDAAVAAAQLRADQAFNNAATAAEAAGNAQESADGKGTNWYQDDPPAGTSHKVGDTWFDKNNGYKLHTWTGSIWQTTQDSALAQQTADSKGRTYTQNVAPPVEARLPQNLWNDTSLGVNFTVTKFWDPTANSGAGAWVAVSGKDAADAQAAAAADASAKAAAAINAQAYSLNPSFDDWTSIAPVNYGQWSGSVPVKETVIFKRGPNALRFNVPDSTAQHGVVYQTLLHAPNLEFFTAEIDLYLVSGTLDGSGMILDWNGMTNNRAQIQFATEIPGAVIGKWYRVSKVLRRPLTATGTWTSMSGYLMAQWTGHGTGAAKDIIFDWFNVRPSTTEEILSFKAPTTAYVDTAEADAIAGAALLDNKVNSSRTYINRGLSTNGITNISGPAPVVVDSATAMGGKALQKTGTGNGWWADTNGKQAFDPSALYRMQARIRVTTAPTTGGGTFYMGVQGYLADGTTLCNSTGAATTSLQHYLKVTSHPATGQWVDYVAYFKGNAAGNASGSGTVFDPYKLQANVRHFEPMVIMDYSNGNGVLELSQLSIEVVDTQAALDLAVQDTNTKLLTKTRTYFQAAKPTGGTYLHGDTWIDSDDGNKVYVYNSTNSDFIVAQDAAIDKALYSTFPTDIDTSATNKWLFTKYNKVTSTGHVPQYSDIVGFAGTSSLVSDAATLASAQGDQYIGQLRTIVNVVSSTTVTVTATHDDGARVYVDGVSVYSHSASRANNAISLTLSSGWHVIDFMWAEQSGGDGWTAVSPLLSTQVTSMFAPVSLSAVAATANTAVTSANGKNKIIYSTSDATGTSGYAAGDTWFKRDAGTGVVTAQWEFTTSWQPRTLSESVIGNISAGKIVADWLEAGVIKAGAIDATKLNVSMGGNNLVPNSSFEVDSDSNGLSDSWGVWTRGSGDAGRVFTNTRVAGLFPGSTWAQRVESTTVTNTNQSSIQSSLVFSIGASAKAVLSVYGRASVAGNFDISLRCEDDAGVYKGDAVFVAAFTTTTQRFSGLVVTPAGTTKAKVTISTPGSLSNGHWFEVDGVKAELGDMLSAWSPMTSELLPGTISATMLTADAINGKVITGPTIQTEVTALRGIKLTGTEFSGYDGTTGNKSFSLTSSGILSLRGAITSGSTITGAVVTGSTIQTIATTDRGIKLTDTELSGFDGVGQKNFSLTTSGTLAIRGAIQSGSTIEGARITGTQGLETSLSALTGVKINNAGIKAYDAGNNLTFHLDATTGLLETPGLKANSITGDKIAADAITAKHLSIGDFTNVAYGGEFNSPEEYANWTPNSSTITYTTSAPHAGAGCMSVTSYASQRSATLGTTIAVQPGDKFNIEFYYKTTSDYNGTGANAKFRVGDQTNALLQSTTYDTVQTSWTKVTNVYEVPASGVTALTLSLNFDHTVGTVWIDSLTMRKQVGVTLIQDGAITTDKIIASGINGGKITAGTLTSTQIQSKSILADDLVISSTDNLVVEADFGNNGTSWDLTPANKSVVAGRGRGGTPAFRITGSTSEITSRNLANKIAIDEKNRYRATVWVRSTEALAIGKVNMYLRPYSGPTASADILVMSNPTALVANTWTKVTAMVPELAVGTLAVEVIIAAQNSDTGTWTEIDFVSLTRAMDGNLIVDGAVTAASIKADSINATHLTSESITASAISSTAIDGKIITGATIQTEATAERGIKLTSTEFAGYDGTTGNKSFSLTSGGTLSLKGAITSGSTITGATVTGSTIQTEATTDRGVKLTSTGLTAYTSTGTIAFTLSSSTGRATMSGRVTTGLPGETGSVLLPAAESSSLTTSGLFISRTGTLAGGVTAGVFVSDATSTSPQNLLLRGHENGHVEVETGHMYIRGANTRVGNFSNWALGDAANGSNYLPNLMIQPASGTGYLKLANAPTSSSAANAIIAVAPEGVMYRSTSSIKYKADVQDWNADYRALGLRPRSWIDRNPIDPSMPMSRYYGYIAEEVEEVMPEFVTFDEFGDPESVTYDRMPSPATIAILKDIVRRLDEAGL